MTPAPLEFVSPALARPERGFVPIQRSPLERALHGAPPDVVDVSLSGKLDVRGALDSLELGAAEIVRTTPERALVLCPAEDVVRNLQQLRARVRSVVDVTSALAGIQIVGEQVLRRLTELDLEALPAAGAVARVPATLLRRENEFRMFFPQEYAEYVAEVVLDAFAGLA